MLVIPAIDLLNGRCVRLRQGRKEDITRYDGDPVEVARNFQNEGARWLHVVDLDGAFTEIHSPNRKTLHSIVAAVNIPIQFGGGLRDVRVIEEILELGVSRAVIGTLAVESPETVATLINLFGSDRLAIGIDAKHGRLMTHGWEQAESLEALAFAKAVAQAGVKRIVYTDVARDGMFEGPNVEATCEIARKSGLRVTASGGVSSLDDIKRLKDAERYGVDSVIVGRAIYEKRFSLSEAFRAAND